MDIEKQALSKLKQCQLTWFSRDVLNFVALDRVTYMDWHWNTDLLMMCLYSLQSFVDGNIKFLKIEEMPFPPGAPAPERSAWYELLTHPNIVQFSVQDPWDVEFLTSSREIPYA